MEEPIPSVYKAFLVLLLSIGQLMTLAFSVATCWGGCNGSVFPDLILLGILALGSLLLAHSAYMGLTDAGTMHKLATFFFLVPGVMVSISGVLVFVLGMLALGWHGVMYLLR